MRCIVKIEEERKEIKEKRKKNEWEMIKNGKQKEENI